MLEQTERSTNTLQGKTTANDDVGSTCKNMKSSFGCNEDYDSDSDVNETSDDSDSGNSSSDEVETLSLSASDDETEQPLYEINVGMDASSKSSATSLKVKSDISVEDHANAVFGYAVRHNCSQQEIKDLLSLINLTFPEKNNAAKSVDQLNKLVGHIENFSIYEYCEFCKRHWSKDILKKQGVQQQDAMGNNFFS